MSPSIRKREVGGNNIEVTKSISFISSNTSLSLLDEGTTRARVEDTLTTHVTPYDSINDKTTPKVFLILIKTNSRLLLVISTRIE